MVVFFGLATNSTLNVKNNNNPHLFFFASYNLPVLSTCLLHINNGYGKERRTLTGPW